MEESDLFLPASAREITLRLACPDKRVRWDALMDERHYLEFRQFAGRGLRYVAEYHKQWLALIGRQSGAFKCRPRDRWIGWRPQQQFPRLRLIANNTRMLLLCPPRAVHNLASCVMAANLRRLSADWQEAYGHPLELAETFVDPKRFAGTLSSGRKLEGGRAHPRLFPQQRPLHPAPRPHQDDGASIPCAPERGNGCAIPSRAPPGSRSGRRRCAPQPQALPSLLQEFQGIPDHRRAQGRKFQLPTLPALWALARLSGYRGVDATWRFAGALNQEELRSFGAWRNPRTGRYDPPSRATLHRAMIDTDPKRFQSALQRWVACRQPSATALAADGKRLRGANRQGDAHYQPVAKVVTAFDRVCIPADCVAPRSHTPGMLPQSALSGGRSPGLGARGTFTTDCYENRVSGSPRQRDAHCQPHLHRRGRRDCGRPGPAGGGRCPRRGDHSGRLAHHPQHPPRPPASPGAPTICSRSRATRPKPTKPWRPSTGTGTPLPASPKTPSRPMAASKIAGSRS